MTQVRMITVSILAISAAVITGAERPLEWPQFRGPAGTGIAEDQKPPVEIGREKNLKWRVSVPSGLSSPILAGELLIITAFENEKLYTIAYRRTNGEEVWRAQASAPQLEKYHKTEGSPAASTPATDGKRIVSYFGSCGLLCYDLAGKELWKFELPPISLPGDFGSGVSPIVADGLAILVRDQLQDSKIYAIDLDSGKVRWETKRLSPCSYCTPIVWETPAGKQIAAAGHARLTGYDAQTGKELWSTAGVPTGCCSSPMIADGLLYFAGAGSGGADDADFKMPAFDEMLKNLDKDKDEAISRAEGEKSFEGFFDNQDLNKDGIIRRDEWEILAKFFAEGQNSAFALKAGGTGDVTESHVLWKKTKGLPYVTSALIYQGQCVTIKDGGIVSAIDAKTGEDIFRARVAADGRYYASPVAANGNIYFTSLEGAVTVLKGGTDKPVVVASNPKLDERTAATPAIADNTLYLRTDKYLYAFSEDR